MSYALFWLELVALLLLWVATGTAILSKTIRRKWAYRLLLTLAVLVPLLTLAALTTASAILKFGEDFQTNWFYYSCGLDVAFVAGTIAILIRAHRRDNPMAPRSAATWGAGRLSLAFLTVLALTTMTLWNMDLAVRAQAGAMQVEAGALLLDASPPALGDSQNAAPLYEKAFAQIDAHKAADDAEVFNADMPNPRDPRAMAILQRQASALALLRQAAAMPDCRFDHDTGRFDIQALLAQFSRLREAQRLLAMRARAQSAGGDLTNAIADVDASFALSHNTGREPLVIGWLLAVGIEAQAVFTLQDVLPAVTHADQLATIHPPDPSAFRRSHRRALQGEEAMGLTIFSQLCGAQPLGGQLVPPAVYQQFAMPAPYRVFLLVDDVNSYRQLMADAQRLAALPYFKSHDQITNLRSQQPMVGPLTSIVAPSIVHAFQDSARIEALDAAAVIAIAMTRYRLDHKVYPANLDDLLPTYLDAVPIDPFDGKPMKLASRPGQCVIYSAGPKDTPNLDEFFQDKREHGEPFLHLRAAAPSTTQP